VPSSGQDVSDFECNSKGCRAYCAGSSCDVLAMCGRFLGQGVHVTTSTTFQISVVKAMTYTVCYLYDGSPTSAVRLSNIEVQSPAGTSFAPQSFATGSPTKVTVSGKGLRASDRLLLVAGTECLTKGKYPTQANLSPIRALSSSGGTKNNFLVTVPNGKDGVWSACYCYGKKGDFSSKLSTVIVTKAPQVSSFSIGGGSVKLDKLPVGISTMLKVVGSGLTFKDRLAIVRRDEKEHQPCSAASRWTNHISGTSSADSISESSFEISATHASVFAVCYEFGGGMHPKIMEIGTLSSM